MASIHGWYGTLRSSSQWPNSTVVPDPCATWAACDTSVDFPMPASPATSTMRTPPDASASFERADHDLQLGFATEESEQAVGRRAHEPSRQRDASHRGFRFPHHLDCADRMRETLQLELTDGTQLVTGVATDEHPDDVGREHLSADRRGTEPRRFDHRVAEVVAILLGRLSG